jgi:hypothetical protein
MGPKAITARTLTPTIITGLTTTRTIITRVTPTIITGHNIPIRLLPHRVAE